MKAAKILIMGMSCLIFSGLSASQLVAFEPQDESSLQSFMEKYGTIPTRPAVIPAPERPEVSRIETVMDNPYHVDGKRTQTSEQEAAFLELYKSSADRVAISDMTITDALREVGSRSADIDDETKFILLNIGTPSQAEPRINPLKSDRISLVQEVSGRLPSLSDVQNGTARIPSPSTPPDEFFDDFSGPKNIFLTGWELVRDGEKIFVQRTGDNVSRIEVRSGMILGEFGRVMAIRSTKAAFYIVLESGDKIKGTPS